MQGSTTSTSSTNTFRSWGRLFKETAMAWYKDGALRLSAALAYYSVFSIAPLVIITISLAGIFLGDEAARGEVYKAMAGYVGSQAAEGVQGMVESASKPGTGVVATVVGFSALLIGASGVLGQLKDALNTIWEVEVKEGAGLTFFLRSKFLNFGMVLVIGFLLLVSLLASSFLATVNQAITRFWELPAGVWTALAALSSIAMATLLFAMLFKFLPDAKIRWRDVWMGAAITAVLFELGKIGLGWYLGRESTADAYGAAGSIVLLLLWIYYASCILLFGAEWTQAYATAGGHVIEPAPQARRVVVQTIVTESVPDRIAEAPAPPVFKTEPYPSHSERQEGHHAPRGTGSIFSHRLLEPVLKYLEGRGLLLSIEAKEALGQAATMLILAAFSCVTLVIAWSLLATALVGLLMSQLGWSWVGAVSATGGGHLVLTVVVGLMVWLKAVKGTWFKETFNELRKDRLWLRGKAH
jgi:membrane protein